MAKKILVADDEEDIKIIVQLFLESKGYEIITAYDGLDAVDKATNEAPDLVLLDVMMPLLDGFQVCQKLKDNPKTKDIPIVMLSASGETQSKKRATEAGAVDYVAKPFEPDTLNKVIESHLS